MEREKMRFSQISARCRENPPLCLPDDLRLNRDKKNETLLEHHLVQCFEKYGISRNRTRCPKNSAYPYAYQSPKNTLRYARDIYIYVSFLAKTICQKSKYKSKNRKKEKNLKIEIRHFYDGDFCAVYAKILGKKSLKKC